MRNDYAQEEKHSAWIFLPLPFLLVPVQCPVLFMLLSPGLPGSIFSLPFRALLQPPCLPADEGVDEACLAEEALRVEQLGEVEISNLEGAFVQVRHRSLLGLGPAMSSCCPARAGAQSFSEGMQCPGRSSLGWPLDMFPKMPPCLKLRQQQ